MVDITDQKRDAAQLKQSIEAAESANEAKSLFLAMMSHEIRTPMNGVFGMTSLLMNTTLNEEQMDYAKTIQYSSDSLLTIINEILDFSKIESGKMELEEVSFDLAECVKGALDLMVTPAFEKGVDLLYELSTDLPEIVLGDSTRLRQIVVNLISNALKFTEKGNVALSLGTTQLIANEIVLEFSIKDSGIGIPANRVDSIFDSFSQADSTTTRKYGGTGLGLSISKRLAELMGGRMWVESVEGEGSTFFFTAVVGTKPQLSRSIWDVAKDKVEGKRVLIVDDSPMHCRILSDILKKVGVVTKCIIDSSTVLEALNNDSLFDVAIVDMHMPELDGIELAKQLKGDSRYGQIPLVIHSSIGERLSDEDHALFVSSVCKPATPRQILTMLMKVFETAPVKRGNSKNVSLPQPESNLRVLLVEDHLINQKVALRILSSIGYKADLASNGIEALEALGKHAYDMIFMDMQMPEMDGLTATRKIVERLPNVQERPWIIALTANAILGDREKCLEAGMDAYLSKPIKAKELEREIRKGILDMKQSGRCQAGSRTAWEASFPSAES